MPELKQWDNGMMENERFAKTVQKLIRAQGFQDSSSFMILWDGPRTVESLAPFILRPFRKDIPAAGGLSFG